ncbi:hypothetical protein PQR65_12490 [Paraburkholderia nemoris]|uniref:hypothetical protein n=1 Tax=Paraburkholderia nemoris TaxID=2793076 RepID=UPI0038B94093
MGKPVENEWKFNWDEFAKSIFSWERIGQFIRYRVPQIFLIWCVVGLLLNAQVFVGAFEWFGKRFSSPFFHVDSVSASQPVDLTPFFLIGIAGLLILVVFVVGLGGCFKLCQRKGWRRPKRLEKQLAHFSGRLTDEVSSILTHISAATFVMLIDRRAESIGRIVFELSLTLAVFAFVLAGICYREE